MIKSLRNALGMFIDLLKWPMALISLAVLLPSIVFIAKYIGGGHVLHPVSFKSFLYGFAFISFVQIVFKTYTASFVKIVEHELTHGLFALLTFNKIVGFDFTPETGSGSIILKGRLNWLVIVSPYFFPLLTVLFILFLYVHFKLTGVLPGYAFAGLGITTAFHFWTTLFECHPHQTDLQRIGYPFSICFIPGANAVVYALMTVFVDRGMTGLGQFWAIFKDVMF